MTTIAVSEDTKAEEPTKDSIQSVENPTSDEVPKITSDVEYAFTRENIDALGNNVRVTDKCEDTGLELLCYVRCTTEDDSLLRRCRGVVFHGKKIVMHAFPYTVEFTHSDSSHIEETIGPVLEKSFFYDSHEGALIRAFFFGDKWHLSTHRKLNAFKSKWSSRESFGTCFKRALAVEVKTNKALRESIPEGSEGLLERFQSTLDPSKQYMFLVRHTEENRIVCAAPEEPVMYHVGTFVDGQLSLDEKINIPYPKQHDFQSLDEVTRYTQDIDIRELQGIICFAPDNKQYKIVHSDYQDLFRARGNEPSIKFRYLQIRMDRKLIEMLYHLYPSWEKRFDEIENTIYSIAREIYNAYVQRFIKKRFVTVPPQEFGVIKECHKWHEEDRTNNRISIEKVIETLNKQTPTALNRMIRRFKNEKNTQEQNKTDAKQRVRSNTISSTSSPAVGPIPASPIQSPLILSKNPKRNPMLPPSPNLGPSALPTCPVESRSLLTRDD